DWFSKFYGGTSNNSDVHVRLSGGASNATFTLSAGYNRSSYNFPGDFAESRYTLHGGFHFNSKDNKLSLDFSSDYSYARNNTSAEPNVSLALQMPPHFPDLLDEDGNLVW